MRGGGLSVLPSDPLQKQKLHIRQVRTPRENRATEPRQYQGRARLEEIESIEGKIATQCVSRSFPLSAGSRVEQRIVREMPMRLSKLRQNSRCIVPFGGPRFAALASTG